MKIGITIDFEINFFSNGLQQNIIILNDLINNLESFTSFLIYKGNKIPNEFAKEDFCVPYSILTNENSLSFDLIILMGFTVNKESLTILKRQNKKTKFILMQCGNQYIENMTFSLFEKKEYSPVDNLPELDEIWILPHYEKNISFMKTYYKNNNVKIVPFIWDSLFIDYQLKIYKNLFRNYEPYHLNKNSIIVMEPNLNSSKNCILPLYIIESFEQRFSKLIKSCNLLAAKNLIQNKYFIKLILNLNIYNDRQDFLKLHKRKTLINEKKEFELKYKDILEFFTRNQYKEIENMIFANEKFGNNLMQNLDLSYSMALYFIQKYLSINLLNFSEDYKQDNLTEFLKSNKINTLQIPEILNNNYYSNIKNGNIKLAQNDSKLIAKKLINKITSKIGKLTNNDLYTKKIIELAELVKETNITLNFSAFKNYIEPNSDEKTLEITKLLELTKLINNGSFMNFDDTNPNGNFNIPEVIKSFDNLLIRGMNSNRGVYLDGFNQYFDDYLSKFDVLMIKTLKDNEIKKLNSNNIDQKFIENLNNLHPVYNNLSSMAKSYFESEKYLDSNKMLKYIKDVLVHLTQNIICYNIEMIMRKVLFNHFKNNDDKLDIINRNIEFIFNFDKMLENEYSNMKDILYKVVAEKLVTNSVNVFKNEDDQDTYDNQTTDEILENYFNLLTISNVFPISNDSQVMKILKDEVTSYFNTITNKIIENWMIVIENQLRFIINQERIIKCIIKMTY